MAGDAENAMITLVIVLKPLEVPIVEGGGYTSNSRGPKNGRIGWLLLITSHLRRRVRNKSQRAQKILHKAYRQLLRTAQTPFQMRNPR